MWARLASREIGRIFTYNMSWKNTKEYSRAYYLDNKDDHKKYPRRVNTGKPVGRPISAKTREKNCESALRWRLDNPEQYKLDQNRRYRDGLSGYHHLYYRCDENYIGVTNSLDYRRRQHQCEIIEYSRFKHKLDALIVEALLQFEYGFAGWHRIHAPSKIKQATLTHKRLACSINGRIFTYKMS